MLLMLCCLETCCPTFNADPVCFTPCCLVRYDYQAGELACMLEILACIKGVAALLQQADVWLSGYICQAVFLQMQGFVQLAMTHLDPRNKVPTACT